MSHPQRDDRNSGKLKTPSLGERGADSFQSKPSRSSDPILGILPGTNFATARSLVQRGLFVEARPYLVAGVNDQSEATTENLLFAATFAIRNFGSGLPPAEQLLSSAARQINGHLDFALAEEFCRTCSVLLRHKNSDADTFEQVIATLSKVSKYHPELDSPYQLTAKALLRLRKFDKALACLDEALQRNPSSQHLLLAKGALLHDIHRPSDALAVFSLALRKDPQNVNTLCGMAKTLEVMHQYSEALEKLKQAEKISPEDSEVHFRFAKIYDLLKQPEQALQRVDTALKIEATRLISKRFNYLSLYKVELLTKQGNFAAAHNVLNGLNRENSSNKDLVHARAQVMLAEGRNMEALNLMATIVTVDSAYPLFIITTAKAAENCGKFDLARGLFEKSYEQNPGHRQLLAEFINFLIKHKSEATLNRAEGLIKEGLSLYKQDVGLLYQEAERLIASNDFAAAESFLVLQLQSFPEHIGFSKLLIKIYFAQERFEDARDVVGRSLIFRKNSNDRFLNLSLAKITFMEGALSEAQNLVSNFLGSHENDQVGLSFLATIYANSGEFSKALAVIEKSLAIDSNNPLAQVMRYRLLKQLDCESSKVAECRADLAVFKYRYAEAAVIEALTQIKDGELVSASNFLNDLFTRNPKMLKESLLKIAGLLSLQGYASNHFSENLLTDSAADFMSAARADWQSAFENIYQEHLDPKAAHSILNYGKNLDF